MVALLTPALVEIYIALSALSLLLVGVFQGNGKSQLHTHLAMGIILGALVLYIFKDNQPGVFFDGLLLESSLSIFLKVLILLGSFFVLAIAAPHLKTFKLNQSEFPVLVLLATLGMLVMVSANDLMTLYLGLELQSLALYVLAAFRRDNLKATESGVKYFVLGALASGILLYGSSLLYGFSGTTNFQGLLDVLKTGDPSTGVIIGGVLVLVAICFKISLAPFHMWTPDVYEGVSAPVTAYFSVVPKIAAFGLLMNLVLTPISLLSSYWQPILMTLAIGSIAVGAFGALFQSHIRRLLAYSAIGHMGFVVLGISVLPNLTEVGTSSLIYLTIYVITSLGVFGCLLSLRLDGKSVDQIDHLKGLSKTHPKTSICLAAFMFSMAGIPPLGGFFGKLYVLMSVVEAGFVWIAVVSIVLSVVAAYYYLRVVKVMYFDETEENIEVAISSSGALVVLSSTVFVFFFVALQAPLLQIVNTVVANIVTVYSGAV